LIKFKPNLKIWRLRKSALSIELSIYCPIIFIRPKFDFPYLNTELIERTKEQSKIKIYVGT